MIFDADLLTSLKADESKQQYECFLDTEAKKDLELFSNYDIKKERLDTFLGKYLHQNSKYDSLWLVCIFVFTFSHGQSQIERGFNISDDILVTNLSEDSLISQRIMYDFLKASDQEPHNMIISDDLRCSCVTAGTRYNKALEENRKKKVLTEKEEKKKQIDNEISEVKRQINEAKETKTKLEVEAMQCYDEAGRPNTDIQTLVAKGNGL